MMICCKSDYHFDYKNMTVDVSRKMRCRGFLCHLSKEEITFYLHLFEIENVVANGLFKPLFT